MPPCATSGRVWGPPASHVRCCLASPWSCSCSGPSQSGLKAVFWASTPAGIARGVVLGCGWNRLQRRARPRTKAAQKTAREAVVQAWSPREQLRGASQPSRGRHAPNLARFVLPNNLNKLSCRQGFVPNNAPLPGAERLRARSCRASRGPRRAHERDEECVQHRTGSRRMIVGRGSLAVTRRCGASVRTPSRQHGVRARQALCAVAAATIAGCGITSGPPGQFAGGPAAGGSAAGGSTGAGGFIGFPGLSGSGMSGSGSSAGTAGGVAGATGAAGSAGATGAGGFGGVAGTAGGAAAAGIGGTGGLAGAAGAGGTGASACTSDAECAPNGWCRPTLSGPSQCTPFRQ